MLFDYTYLLNQFSTDLFSDPAIEKSSFIIPVNDAIAASKLTMFETLMNTKHNFCFIISADLAAHNKTFIKEEIIQHLVRLLFLPGYVRKKGNYIFYYEQPDKNETTFQSVQEQFSAELKKQGINISLVPVTQHESQCIINNYLSEDGNEESFNKLKTTFNFSELIAADIIIPVKDKCDLKNKTRLITAFESWIATAEPLKVTLNEMYKTAHQNSAELKDENELLKFKLDNSASYLELIKKESAVLLNHLLVLRHENQRLNQLVNNNGTVYPELAAYADNPDFIMLLQSQVMAQKKRADETLAWYLKEYEALPMWYKRTGQVLRVLTGKRTFKSLFKKDKHNDSNKTT